MTNTHPSPPPGSPSNRDSAWIPLAQSARFLFSNLRILFTSLLLFFITFGITWIFYQASTSFVDQYAARHLIDSPDPSTVLGWLRYQGWVLLKWIFLIISRVISFYIAFLSAYCLTTPGYAFLSLSVERKYSGEQANGHERFSLRNLKTDLLEGCKIGIFGIVVTCVALGLNFIPGIGQFLVFLLYCYYSCLMFIDYPASQRRWTLGKKIAWLKDNTFSSLRLGLLPALVSMLPVLNVFVIAMLFPLLTVHATLNFIVIESATTGSDPLKSK